MYTDQSAVVVPVPAGPPLSFASSPWRCSVPAPCFVPAEPVRQPCPPRAPLSAPHVASYTPAYNTTWHTDICIYVSGTWLIPLSNVIELTGNKTSISSHCEFANFPKTQMQRKQRSAPLH